MKKADITNSSELFFYKAQVDFNSAKALLELFEAGKIEIDMEKINFDLQQSVEKLLKSLLAKKSVAIPKVHDIKYLIDKCKQNNIPLIDNIQELIELNEYAVEGRYCIICDDIQESYGYLELTHQLLQFVEEQIQ